MKEILDDNKKREEAITILESAPLGYTRLSDMRLEEMVALCPEKDLKRLSDYIFKSYFEQFGVEVEIAFVKEPPKDNDHAAHVKAYLKAKELPTEVKFEELRLFKISKDSDIHDGHYYISYDTKDIAGLDRIYGDAIWFGAKGLEYEKENRYSGRKIKLKVQDGLRHHGKQSGGANSWEIEIVAEDMKKKNYLEVFENPSHNNAENICRELVKRAGAYVMEKLKMRSEKF
ncbi:MAG: hypothetical protein UU95_C0021G0006 [Parcubacteria group bacterium GW2011_GWC2_42_12]|uniref:Uncharacterized protein n=2 Tax=Candidatus Falkowiibacteriota TaxID=1752728 RepID=A0A0G0XUX2_9BACT|nr:MAG: hypothetical protein UU43_C0002G0011 [Candidatus Falkowbacteria bacterium GW2011_GWA2_41_14]KKS33835.1 MAG: hypothetical protein UU95_C0021G0006 [Parcubacteria group bacterium GW2011_GWC2_42_12]